MRRIEAGGGEVARRVAAALVRLGFRRGGAPVARVAGGAAAVLLPSGGCEEAGVREEEEGSPAPPFIAGAW